MQPNHVISSFPFLGASFQTAENNLTVYLSADCNPPWKLEWTSSCFIEDPLIDYGINVLWLDAELEPIKYIKQREGRENGFGVVKYSFQTMRRRFSMKLVVDDLFLDALQKMTLFTDIKLHNLRSGNVYELENVEIASIEEDENHFDYVISLEFEIKDSIVETTGCDCGAYTNAPFESDCGDEALEPRSNEDVCQGFDATITAENNVLSVTTVGGPANTPVYRWYYEPGTGAYQLLSNTAQSITMGGYGTYRVVVQKGSCQIQKDFLNQDPCGGIFLRLSKSNASVTAEFNGCESPTFSWRYVDNAGIETPLADTGQTIVAQQTGNYKVIVTCGTCSREAIIYVEVTGLPENAGIANNITINVGGTILTANVTGCTSALTITWAKDDGSGNGMIPLTVTGPSIEVSGSGLYEATATCGTFVIKATYLIIDCNIPCNVSLSVSKSGNTLSAVQNGCGGQYTISWFRNTGSGYGSAIGTGDSFNISGNGMYKATIQCGEDCQASGEILVYDCNTCSTSVSLDLVDDVITATITGCTSGTPVREWFVDTGSGETKLAETGAVLTATAVGIYRIRVTCDQCEATAGILYTGCANCTPVNTGENSSINVC